MLMSNYFLSERMENYTIAKLILSMVYIKKQMADWERPRKERTAQLEEAVRVNCGVKKHL